MYNIKNHKYYTAFNHVDPKSVSFLPLLQLILHSSTSSTRVFSSSLFFFFLLKNRDSLSLTWSRAGDADAARGGERDEKRAREEEEGKGSATRPKR